MSLLASKDGIKHKPHTKFGYVTADVEAAEASGQTATGAAPNARHRQVFRQRPRRAVLYLEAHGLPYHRADYAIHSVTTSESNGEAVNIGLIGDYDSSVPAHQAIPIAINLAAEGLQLTATFQWIPTNEITTTQHLAHFDGLWCVPASPYRSMDGALLAIRFARENDRPFLGTCGGFQHAVVEYARNVLGWADAEHAETAPEASRAVITPLECSLVEVTDTIFLRPATKIKGAYGCDEIIEGFRCRYGLNQRFLSQLTTGKLRVGAEDRGGDVRALELDDHRFFVTTLFQPERAALKGVCPPLVMAFVRACTA